MAVKPENVATFEEICKRERCPFAVVGTATEEKTIVVNDKHFDSKPIDLPMPVLFGKPPKMHRSADTYYGETTAFNCSAIKMDEAVNRVLQHPSVASKKFLITIGDRFVTGQVARDQMVGPWQVPVADCAVTTVAYDSYCGEAMSMGERTPTALLNAPASGRMAIGEAITNIIATKIEKISDIKLSANWMCAAGHPGEDEKLFRTVETIGMELCPELGLTIPVGKDSMSMRTAWQSENGEDKSVTAPMSVVITAFSPVSDVRKTVTPQLRTDLGESQLLFIDLAKGKQRLGASILAQVFNEMGEDPADVESAQTLKHFFNAMQECLANDWIVAYHDRSDGGLLTTLAEMSFAGRCGVDVDLSKVAQSDDNTALLSALFNEELGGVVQVLSKNIESVQNCFAKHNVTDALFELGQVTEQQSFKIRFGDAIVYENTRAELEKCWAETSFRMQSLRDNSAAAQQEFDQISKDDPGLSVHLTYDINQDVAAPYINKGVKPKIAVLREQGVNSHVEMAASFDRAGFESIDVHMSDLLAGRVSLEAYRGLVVCGGFSYGDVLGAGEGWAKTVLFNEKVRDEFQTFFHRDNTFSLGVCNGCQMMSTIKELIPGAEHWSRFVKNNSEQFESRFSLVKIEQSPSVLLKGMEGSHMPVAVAHGEGRAEFSDANHLQQCNDSGLVSLRYLNNNLSIADTYPANPNGSPDGIGSVTSDDGRVTIMMTHPERVYRAVTNSWKPDDWNEEGAWLRMFRNARVFVD